MINLHFTAAAFAILVPLASLASNKEFTNNTIWSIGQHDSSASEFALYPDGYTNFISHDFGYEDKCFIVNASDVTTEFPYVLPGPTDTWGGTWHTAGWRTHQVNVLFDLKHQPKSGSHSILSVNLADFSKNFLPLVKISINGKSHKYQLETDYSKISTQRKPSLGEPLVENLALTCNSSRTTPTSIDIPLSDTDLKKGGNELQITVLEGSWIMFDNLQLTSDDKNEAIVAPSHIFIRDIRPASYQLDEYQPLLVDIEHLDGTPVIEIYIDDELILSQPVETGRYCLEAPMQAVSKPTSSKYTIKCDGVTLATGSIVRSPMPRQTPADYVDTRIGTAHSRWMIAPGPWMPFGMVKLSPDNQNTGWQAGYQPSFENIGCFSHIHEWTLSGIGIMPSNGPLMTHVGDEQKPDEGYRSRIDKSTETASIGYYAANLSDYNILAETTATTRCGMFRFTFPADSINNRILIELHPQAEYDFQIKDLKVNKVSSRRIEGSCRQLSPEVWSNDASQDYTLHFVIEFDQPFTSLGAWLNDSIIPSIDTITDGQFNHAGLFAQFDVLKNPVVRVRTSFSAVSVDNASDNLRSEISIPFNWDFDAVRQNQKKAWNELLGRIEITTTDRLEKIKFYNNMYRALCSRNIWSDCNGEWRGTDGEVHRVNNPDTDVMIGCDAFWNTFWNLNQFWNLVTPEWSSRWVHSQLSLYNAYGWLAKGPAGLNYIPVMVAEHEIPLIVSAWQMGIRDFDPHEALNACVKMQSTPATKVYNGFAGNRDLVAYLNHKYVPSDLGRFSNTMEYSFDDWTVGQLAKSIGVDSVYTTFNERGNWWKNVIDDDGYCHLRDSNGNWASDFDPFRSGANHHYVEGNAWQLTFFVPQDIHALIDKIGHDRFVQRLLWGFNQDEAWRYNAPNDQYWDHPIVQGNQQSMHFAWLFNFAGMPWLTQCWSRSVLSRYYGSEAANAYLGDEDQGQMSAWAVMASIGLFQMDGGCSHQPTYQLGSPSFPLTVINLGNRYGRGDQFRILAKKASRHNIYIQNAMLNGQPLNSFSFPAKTLLQGGELILEMGPTPNPSWGVEKHLRLHICQPNFNRIHY